MALVLSEEQTLLRDAARGFLEDKAPVSALRELRDTKDETGFSRSLWQEMAEMGWAGILVPEEYGGLGFGHVGAGLIMEEMGRTLTASPLFSTAIVGVTALTRLGSESQRQEHLPALVEGKKTMSLAIDENSQHNPAKTALSAEKSGDSYILNGKKTFVLDGHVADTLIVLARTSGAPGDEQGLSLFLVESNTKGLDITRTIMVDSRNAADVTFNAVSIPAENLLGPEGSANDDLDYILDVARICLAAEMMGLAQEAFDRTLDYLKERKQFGVAIGSFQALQHRAAHLFNELEMSRSVVLKALQAIDENSNQLPLLASLAKAKLSDTVRLAANEGVQLHGGIGMTDEFDMGFFMKRARAAQETFGNANYHADRFGRLSQY